jgi:hypothetical protein
MSAYSSNTYANFFDHSAKTRMYQGYPGRGQEKRCRFRVNAYSTISDMRTEIDRLSHRGGADVTHALTAFRTRHTCRVTFP